MSAADINVQMIQGGAYLSNSNPVPVSFVPAKITALLLFGGAIAASVTEASATVIDMRKYTKGALSALFATSGSGTISLAFFGSDIGTDVFKQIHQEKNDKAGYEAKPVIGTTASTSLMYEVAGITCNYLKIIPTVSGTTNYTFAFTPSI